MYDVVCAKLLENEDENVVEKMDCCGLLCASTEQKVFAALRMLANDGSADSIAERSLLGASINMEIVKEVFEGVIHSLEGEWVRRPNESGANKLTEEYARLGFKGCLGCLDCTSLKRDAYLITWQSMCKEKDKAPTVRLEVICDDYLQIWRANFGAPGAKNDIQIFELSKLFNDIRAGA